MMAALVISKAVVAALDNEVFGSASKEQEVLADGFFEISDTC